jgi:hypothetical protein
MKKIYRILISIGVCFATLFSCTYFAFQDEIELGKYGLKIIAFISLVAGYLCYKILKKTPEEQIKINTKIIESFHSNGIAKERGQTINGKNEGEWQYYNEEGKLIKEVIYQNGDIVKTMEY